MDALSAFLWKQIIHKLGWYDEKTKHKLGWYDEKKKDGDQEIINLLPPHLPLSDSGTPSINISAAFTMMTIIIIIIIMTGMVKIIMTLMTLTTNPSKNMKMRTPRLLGFNINVGPTQIDFFQQIDFNFCWKRQGLR